MNIAILGATGQVGKSLVSQFLQDTDFKNHLFLFARNPQKLSEFLNLIHADLDHISICDLNSFSCDSYDVIINCIGHGTPESIKNNMNSLAHLTDYYDNLIIKFLEDHPTTKYIYMSSGIVYDSKIHEGAHYSDLVSIDLNNITNENLYRLSKIQTELKHRLLSSLNIIDIRIFGFCSFFTDFNSGFLIGDILNALQKDQVFITNNVDIVRDYVSDSDFYRLVKKCIIGPHLNCAIDATSVQPIKKQELLGLLQKDFGLKYQIENVEILNPTGLKIHYYSTDKESYKRISFEPVETAYQAIQKVFYTVISKQYERPCLLN